MEIYEKPENKKYIETLYNIDFSKVGFCIKPNIAKLLGIDDTPQLMYPERWDTVKIYYDDVLYTLDDYYISTYGRCYDTNKCKLLSQHLSVKNSEGIPYKTYRLYINNRYGRVEVFIHRILASTFLPKKSFETLVNHKDGNPSHNYIWNVEWSTVSMNYIHCISTGLKIEPVGEKRSNAKWSDNDIHKICELMAQGHKSTYIYNYMKDKYPDNQNITYEKIRTLYKHIKHKTHWYHISKLYNIDFTKYNYSKEQSSVKNMNNKYINQNY